MRLKNKIKKEFGLQNGLLIYKLLTKEEKRKLKKVY